MRKWNCNYCISKYLNSKLSEKNRYISWKIKFEKLNCKRAEGNMDLQNKLANLNWQNKDGNENFRKWKWVLLPKSSTFGAFLRIFFPRKFFALLVIFSPFVLAIPNCNNFIFSSLFQRIHIFGLDCPVVLEKVIFVPYFCFFVILYFSLYVQH